MTPPPSQEPPSETQGHPEPLCSSDPTLPQRAWWYQASSCQVPNLHLLNVYLLLPPLPAALSSCHIPRPSTYVASFSHPWLSRPLPFLLQACHCLPAPSSGSPCLCWGGVDFPPPSRFFGWSNNPVHMRQISNKKEKPNWIHTYVWEPAYTRVRDPTCREVQGQKGNMGTKPP